MARTVDVPTKVPDFCFVGFERYKFSNVPIHFHKAMCVCVSSGSPVVIAEADFGECRFHLLIIRVKSWSLFDQGDELVGVDFVKDSFCVAIDPISYSCSGDDSCVSMRPDHSKHTHARQLLARE